MIGIIGFGKVGTSLARYFLKKNMKISGFYTKNRNDNKSDYKTSSFKKFSSTKELLVSSKIIMISVPDDKIIEVWNEILKEDIRGKTIFHTSGAHSKEIFKNGSEKGAICASLHPMMTFSGKDTSLEKMSQMVFALEGESEELVDLITQLDNKYITINEKNKVNYHLAGVFACNLMISMVERGIQNLRKCGLSDFEAREILMPLIKKTIENIEEKGSKSSISGPLERGDIGTIKKHLDNQTSQEKKLYIEGTKEIFKILNKNDPTIQILLEETK